MGARLSLCLPPSLPPSLPLSLSPSVSLPPLGVSSVCDALRESNEHPDSLSLPLCLSLPLSLSLFLSFSLSLSLSLPLCQVKEVNINNMSALSSEAR